MYSNQSNFGNSNRSFGGPILPFVLGGVVGSLWSNNNHGNNNYVPYPVYPYYPYSYPYYPSQYPMYYQNYYY